MNLRAGGLIPAFFRNVRLEGRLVPRFFFDTTDATLHTADEEGVELTDADAARRLAFAAIGELLRDLAIPGRPTICRTTVRDETGSRLFTVTGQVSAKETA